MWYDDCDCSAGLAIQGEYVYTAARGSVTSAEALRFPFIPLITLTNAFLRFPFMTNVVTDTHFYQVLEPSHCIEFVLVAFFSLYSSDCVYLVR